MLKEDFETYLQEENLAGSGRASSYLKALQWLRQMLEIQSYGFDDCVDIWSIESDGRLTELRTAVLEEQKKKASPWITDGIPVSYLRNGYCAAALTQLIDFLPHHLHANKILKIYDSHEEGEEGLAEALSEEPELDDSFAHDSNSKDGKDRIRERKERIGQSAFRRMVLRNYLGCCAITGLDIATSNRASHIIGWADRRETRMLPSNGICLSATYDAAFDKKLISFDEDYRLIVSKEIRDHYGSDSVRQYFEKLEGEKLTAPMRDVPKQKYLVEHRKAGGF